MSFSKSKRFREPKKGNKTQSLVFGKDAVKNTWNDIGSCSAEDWKHRSKPKKLNQEVNLLINEPDRLFTRTFIECLTLIAFRRDSGSRILRSENSRISCRHRPVCKVTRPQRPETWYVDTFHEKMSCNFRELFVLLSDDGIPGVGAYDPRFNESFRGGSFILNAAGRSPISKL